MLISSFPCPCCGFHVFEHEPGSHHTCPICCWEDNLVQLRFPLMPGAANHVSLVEGQQNFKRIGAAERRHLHDARPPLPEDVRDAGWRELDLERDNPETPCRGIRYADSYPEADYTVLYYWRPNYWRRFSS